MAPAVPHGVHGWRRSQLAGAQFFDGEGNRVAAYRVIPGIRATYPAVEREIRDNP